MKDWRGGKWAHEARLRLSGDTSAAKKLVGYGRQLLGHLRDMVSHGGAPTQVIRKRLPDGSEVVARLINGQAIVEIFASRLIKSARQLLCQFILTPRSDTAFFGWDALGAVVPTIGAKSNLHKNKRSTTPEVISGALLHRRLGEGLPDSCNHRVSKPSSRDIIIDGTAIQIAALYSSANYSYFNGANLVDHASTRLHESSIYADNYVLYAQSPATKAIYGYISGKYYVVLAGTLKPGSSYTFSRLYIQTFSTETGQFVTSFAVPNPLEIKFVDMFSRKPDYDNPGYTASIGIDYYPYTQSFGHSPPNTLLMWFNDGHTGNLYVELYFNIDELGTVSGLDVYGAFIIPGFYTYHLISGPSGTGPMALSGRNAEGYFVETVDVQFMEELKGQPFTVADVRFFRAAKLPRLYTLDVEYFGDTFSSDGNHPGLGFNAAIRVDVTGSLCLAFGYSSVSIVRPVGSTSLEPIQIYSNPIYGTDYRCVLYGVHVCQSSRLALVIFGFVRAYVDYPAQKVFLIDLDKVASYDGTEPCWEDISTTIFPDATTFNPSTIEVIES